VRGGARPHPWRTKGLAKGEGLDEVTFKGRGWTGKKQPGSVLACLLFNSPTQGQYMIAIAPDPHWQGRGRRPWPLPASPCSASALHLLRLQSRAHALASTAGCPQNSFFSPLCTSVDFIYRIASGRQQAPSARPQASKRVPTSPPHLRGRRGMGVGGGGARGG
jgi:hypothetical protein